MIRTATTIGLAAAVFLAGCAGEPENPLRFGSEAERLQPVTRPLPEPTIRGSVYVPVYSSIYLGLERGVNAIELGVTLSVRNTSPGLSLVLHAVDYYDSAGTLVRHYLEEAGQLAPFATVEFVVLRSDVRGGPGANFLVRWEGPAGIDPPLIEAVMVGQFGNAGISFTGQGRAIQGDTPR